MRLCSIGSKYFTFSTATPTNALIVNIRHEEPRKAIQSQSRWTTKAGHTSHPKRTASIRLLLHPHHNPKSTSLSPPPPHPQASPSRPSELNIKNTNQPSSTPQPGPAYIHTYNNNLASVTYLKSRNASASDSGVRADSVEGGELIGGRRVCINLWPWRRCWISSVRIFSMNSFSCSSYLRRAVKQETQETNNGSATISSTSITALAQDPVFNNLDFALLDSLGITAVQTPTAFESVDDSTLLFAPGAEKEHLALVLPSNPPILFGGPLEGVEEGPIRRFVSETESIKVVLFEECESAFWMMRLYMMRIEE